MADELSRTPIYLSATYGQRGLIFAVRLSAVSKLLLELLGLFGVLCLLPLLVAVVAGQWEVALRYLAICVGTAVGWYCARHLPRVQNLQRNETLCVAALLFTVSSLLLVWPIQVYGIGFLDAWFEAVSGVTTTGLSTLGSVEDKPVAFLFARGWSQWAGGLGVVVLALAIYTQPGLESRQFGEDTTEKDRNVGGTRAHSKRILIVYMLLTVAGIGLLFALGSRPIDAVVHSMTAISTGGFANYDDSLASLDFSHQFSVTMIALLGAIGLHLYYRPSMSSLKASLADTELRLFMMLVLLMPCVVLVTARLAGTQIDLWDAMFATVSSQTTAGFANSDVNTFGPAVMAILCCCMLVGGCMGSTAGGVKVFRLLVMLKLLQLFLLRSSTGERSQPIQRIDGRPLVSRTVENVLAILTAYVAFLAASWIIFLAHGQPPIESLYEVASALATAGVTSGLTGPDLAPALKLVLIINMLVGRVETVAIVVLLYPRTWIGRRRN